MASMSERRIQHARDAGWNVVTREHNTVSVKAALTGVGYVKFVLLSCGWVCDLCGERVTVSQFSQHGRQIH